MKCHLDYDQLIVNVYFTLGPALKSLSCGDAIGILNF